MERNDNYTVFENPEALKISFLHSSGFKLLMFGLLLLVYGIVFSVLFASNTFSLSKGMQAITERQSSWYSGYSALSPAHLNLTNYLNLSNEDYLEGFRTSEEELSDFIDLLSDEEAGVYAHDLASLCEKYLEAANQTITYHEGGDSEQMLASYETAENIQRLISIFSSYSMKEMEDSVSVGLAEQNAAMMERLKNIIIALLIVTIVIVGIAGIFFRYFLSPLYDLTNLILETSTDTWTVRQAPDTRRDEMGLLIHAFYGMMNKICLQFEELLHKQQLEAELLEEREKNIRTEALLAQSELKAFQSQINSHFLFNTMNIISRLAYLENASCVQNAVNLLAQFLRTVLDQFNRIVTLTEEFDNIQNYVEIQKLRFGDRIQFESDMDVELEWFRLPSMTLQPLVENSFQHGVAGKKQGFIRCAAEQGENEVLLYVWDDGVGLSKEKCRQLEKNLTEDSLNENPGQCIGLVNVYRRLCLCYPGQVTPILEGEEDKFSKIGFQITIAEKSESEEPEESSALHSESAEPMPEKDAGAPRSF